jgi:competence protein ComEC
MTTSAWGLRCTALALAALAGVAWQLGWAALPPTGTMLALLLAAGGLLAWAAYAKQLVAACVALALLAAALTSLRAEHRLAQRLDPALEGVELELTGVIASLPQRQADAERFVFEVESARHQDRAVTVPQRLSLAWFRSAQDDLLSIGPDTRLAAGQRWRFGARLRRPHGLANPHGFDFELWLFERSVGATGSVRATAAQPAELLRSQAAQPIERARQHVSDAIAAQVPDPRAAGVLAALAVGEQSAIERDDWDLFRDTGVAHLMSISGLHVTMFAWLAQALVAALWRRSRRLVHVVATPHAARWGGLAAAAGYALLAGWGVPAQRTLWMLATAALLSSLGRRWPWPLVLLAAAVVVAAIDPWALLQPGFWLSFVAVGLLLLAAPPPRELQASSTWPERLWRLLRGGLRTQVVATLGLAPLTLLFFQQVSLVGFVANLVAIPVVTLLITPLALLGVLWPALWSAAALLVQALSTLLAALTGPQTVWSAAVAPVWAQALGLLAGVLLVAPLPWRLRAVAALMLLPLLLPAPPRPAVGQFELVALDVGQGSAVLLRTHAHLLIYDTGPRYGEADAGERVLLPLLRARGERRIDVLALSHGDNDHIGGAASLLAALPVGQLVSSLDAGHTLLAGRTAHRRCIAGERWIWDGVAFEWLHPAADGALSGATPNALSCVLRVSDASGRHALLAGDIEGAQEAALVERVRDRLPAEILLVPHHGSRTSSSVGFVGAVAPRFALVQAGYRNRYGHPAPVVVERYAAIGSVLVRSDRCGAWTWHAGQAHCERDRRRRYWQSP